LTILAVVLRPWGRLSL